MKLKERLVAASVGFMLAIGLIALWPMARSIRGPETLSSPSVGFHPQQRQLQKTDTNSGQSEVQNVSEEWAWKRKDKVVRISQQI